MNDDTNNWIEQIHNRDKKVIVDDVYNRLKKRNEQFHDEVKKTIKYIEGRIKRNQSLNVPELIIEVDMLSLEEEKQKLNMSVLEYEEIQKKNEKHDLIEKQLYIKNNPPTEEKANKIWKYFDLWFEKYKDNYDFLYDEYSTGHDFYEPFFWGEGAMLSKLEFYEHILTPLDEEYGSYESVFYVCRQKIEQRLEELDPPREPF